VTFSTLLDNAWVTDALTESVPYLLSQVRLAPAVVEVLNLSLEGGLFTLLRGVGNMARLTLPLSVPATNSAEGFASWQRVQLWICLIQGDCILVDSFFQAFNL